MQMDQSFVDQLGRMVDGLLNERPDVIQNHAVYLFTVRDRLRCHIQGSVRPDGPQAEIAFCPLCGERIGEHERSSDEKGRVWWVRCGWPRAVNGGE